MAYRKRTLRQMSQLQRLLATYASDCESLATRLKHLVAKVGEVEFELRALRRGVVVRGQGGGPAPALGEGQVQPGGAGSSEGADIETGAGL